MANEELLAEIMRKRIVEIGREVAKLEDERAAMLDWLAAHRRAKGGTGR